MASMHLEIECPRGCGTITRLGGAALEDTALFACAGCGTPIAVANHQELAAGLRVASSALAILDARVSVVPGACRATFFNGRVALTVGDSRTDPQGNPG